MWLHRLEASICELVIDFVVGGPLDETIILILAKDTHQIYFPLIFSEGIEHQMMNDRGEGDDQHIG